MTGDPRLRASDADRDKTAALLREHHAVGRLTPEEFDERLDQALSAKTIGDLDALLADLPGIDLYRLPDHGLPRRPPVPGHSSHLSAVASAGAAVHPHGRFSPAWGAAWGSWLSVSSVLVVIWLLSGAGYPWFLWVAAPWGVLMLVRWLTGGHPDQSGHSGGRPSGGGLPPGGQHPGSQHPGSQSIGDLPWDSDGGQEPGGGQPGGPAR
jgi:hypothetical protein